MNLRGVDMNVFYELAEQIAKLIDESIDSEIDDTSNINDLILKEIDVAYHKQQRENVEINGGSK